MSSDQKVTFKMFSAVQALAQIISMWKKNVPKVKKAILHSLLWKHYHFEHLLR